MDEATVLSASSLVGEAAPTSWAAVGPELAAALAALDVASTPYPELLDVAARWEAVRAWADAGQAEVLAALDRRAEREAAVVVTGSRGQLREVWQWHRDQIALALGVGSTTATHRVTAARRLVDELPRTHAALREGRIGGAHAGAVVSAVRTVDAELAGRVDEVLHPGAQPDDEGEVLPASRHGWRTPRQLERAAARVVAELDPAGAVRRHRRALGDRTVQFRPAEDGMTSMWALLAAEDAAALEAALDAHARAGAARPEGPGDHRTLAQRRADALVALGVDALVAPDAADVDAAAADVDADPAEGGGDPAEGDAAPAGPSGRTRGGPGRRATVHVTIDWLTLLGLADRPGDLSGYGPIDAATARRLAADPTATWRRLVTDPVTGEALDLGRTRYRPSADLTAFVMARDAWCRHPACDRPAASSDLDHRTRWVDGGPTRAANVDVLCRRHHRMKDEGGWTHERDALSGDSVWTSPVGQLVRKPPHRVGRPPDPSARRAPDLRAPDRPREDDDPP